MGLGQLSFLNIQMLQSQTMSQPLSSLSVEGETFSASEVISSFLGDEYAEVMLTNSYSQRSSDVGFYTLIINRKVISLLERCSIKKNEFKIIIETPELVLNDQPVDVSFLESVLQKINKIIEDYNKGNVTIVGKQREAV